MGSQRGFTLLETLVALAIALPLGFALLAILGGGIRTATAAAQSGADADALGTLGERLDAESHGAAAIFTAPSELDFFSRDATGAPHFWAYRYDAAAKTLTRYVYDDLNASGPVNLRSFGPKLSGIVAFAATRVPLSQVTIPALGGYAAPDVAVPLGYPGVAGGNALVIVDVQSASSHIHRELAPRLAASGFGVVVGTYVPNGAATAAPLVGGSSSLNRYFGRVQWRVGPCVGVNVLTPGCSPGDDAGLIAEQDGDDVVSGGPITAPPASSIPLADVCYPATGANPNAAQLFASIDALGNAYVAVADLQTGLSEWWSLSPIGYAAPQPPLRPVGAAQISPLGPTLVAGPGYWYQTTYWLAC